MKNWTKFKLRKLLTESKVVSESPNTDKRIRVKLNVQGVEKRPETKDKKGATKYYTRRAGQFIYGKQNLHKGAFGIVPEELDGYESSSDIPAFDVDPSCYPEWIYYYFKKGNFYQQLEPFAKGVGSKRIQPDKIYDLDIWLPDKEEQKKILNQVHSIEGLYSQLNTEIEKQLRDIKLLHQSILKDAIQGKLTAEWRNKNPKIEPVSDLLKRIKTERDELIREKKVRKEKTLPPIQNEELPFELPENWAWVRLQELIKEKPKNGISPRAVSFETQVKSLKLGATTKGFFDPTEVKYLDIDVPQDSPLWLKKNDILIQRSNSIDYVGVSAVYDGSDFEFVYPDLMMKVQPVFPYMSEYIHTALSAPVTRSYFRSMATGTSGSMPKINQTTVSLTLLPFPPQKEQERIQEMLNEFRTNLSNLEGSIFQSKKNALALVERVMSDLFGAQEIFLPNHKKASQKGVSQSRKVIYNSNTTFMELTELLKIHGKLHAEDLWRMSEHPNNIDAFYAELKKEVEDKRTIKEVEKEKGYLELV